MKILATILGAAMAGGLATVAAVHGKHAEFRHHQGGGAMMMPHIVDALVDEVLDGAGAYNLTEDQKQKITAVRDRIQSQAEALHVAHDATHEEIKREWENATMDTVKMHAMVDARVDELRRVLLSSVDGVAEIHDTLTAEQRKTLSDHFEARHGEK
jgi:Spy/CpxP family protein refolding chaperone